MSDYKTSPLDYSTYSDEYVSNLVAERDKYRQEAVFYEDELFVMTRERDRFAEDRRELMEALEPVLLGLGDPKIVHMGATFNRYQVSYMIGYYNPIEYARAALDRIKARETTDDH